MLVWHLTFRSQVRVESLYGTKVGLFVPPLELAAAADCSANADITSPNVVKDLKITTIQSSYHHFKMGNKT